MQLYKKMVTLLDATAALGIIFYTIWQWPYNPIGKWREADMPFKPPSEYFPWIWLGMYALIAASWAVALFTVTPLTDNRFVAYYALMIINIAFIKVWSVLAMRQKDMYAFVAALVLVGTGLAIEITLVLMTDLTIYVWGSFVLFGIYWLWTLVAAWINYNYVWNLKQTMFVPENEAETTEEEMQAASAKIGSQFRTHGLKNRV